MTTTSANFHQTIQRLESDIQWLRSKLKGDAVLMALSDPKANWRKGVLSTYKAARAGKAKPLVFWQAREYLEQNYRTEQFPGLEGDDVLGLYATGQTIEGKRIVVSIDKDLQSVPGYLYNPNKPELGVRRIEKDAADRFHLLQTLTGDSVDGYGGCPGVGIKRAEAILAKGSTWESVVAAYERKSKSESYALVQARVARILRYGEYSRKSGEVKLWEPKR